MQSIIIFGIVMVIISVLIIALGFFLLMKERKTGLNRGRSMNVLYFGGVLFIITVVFVIIKVVQR